VSADSADVGIRFGAQLWPQHTSWAEFRDAALAAEAAGFDSIWTWDHLNAIFGPWEQPIFEGWSLLSAVAAVSTKLRLGLLVGANTFRNPGLTAKLATTLDHVSGGRAILGIGGAWFEREHDAFGFETWGSGFGERLDRLDEAVMLLRRLLDGERIADHRGRFYTFHDALCEPRPVQDHLPILIGGSGPKKTLRTTAKYADMWNTGGSLDELGVKVGNLRARCADEGRNPDEIEKTYSDWLLIRDDPAEARRALAELARANGDTLDDDEEALAGSPDLLADKLRPVFELGFTHLIADLLAPYDTETIERLPELRERLRA
jgi:alkanesulfonate monooxygenase SsuD/methylene tetrahydromethanopterin reductase-like flavin-dependent oxidoreductase (luciferase family)